MRNRGTEWFCIDGPKPVSREPHITLMDTTTLAFECKLKVTIKSKEVERYSERHLVLMKYAEVIRPKTKLQVNSRPIMEGTPEVG